VVRNYIARLNADGSLDTSFNVGTGANALVQAIALQTDGKVLIGGSFTTVNDEARNYITRLNSNGSLDASFNIGAGANGVVRSLTLQADGKVLIGGGFTALNGVSINRIARLNSNGSVDASFNPGTGANDFVKAITLQADGKVLIGGEFTTMNDLPHNSIARLNNNGLLDTSFNAYTGGDFAQVEAIVQQANARC